MIIDGRKMAAEVLARTKVRVEALGRVPHVAAIVTSETPATQSYLRIKAKRAADAGCVLDVLQLPEDASTASLRDAVLASRADAILVQLPLAFEVDTKEVCDAIPVSKDADVLSTAARDAFESLDKSDLSKLLPPVVAAVQEIFVQNSVDTKGKKAVVVGEGWLVGKPCATWLVQQGAIVEVITTKNTPEETAAALRAADIVVSGAGSPHFIKPEMLKDGVVLVDAGTSESGGEVVGDADPACADKCSLFTPVPGGVGPLAVACLFENAVTLAERGVVAQY